MIFAEPSNCRSLPLATQDLQASSGSTVVDCHAHVMRRNLPLATQRHSAPKRDVTVGQYLALLDRYGVSHGILTAPSFYGPNNSLLLQALAAAHGRLHGTAIVEPGIEREELEAMRSAGIVGARLNWVKRDTLPHYDSPEYRNLFDAVRDLGWHIEIYLEGAKLARVLPHLREHGAPIVVDHFGSPTPSKGIMCDGFHEVLRGVRAGDTYVKLSAPYRLGGADPQRYVDALLEAGNGRQLVWATDWPFVGYEDSITYEQCLAWIRQWVPDAATRRTILADTPMHLFGFRPAHG
jgi:predicted TIM-barrel fold metal-dependent hydrolase